MKPSSLAEGNLALRNKQFERALHHYRKAEETQPELAHLIQANIKLATRRLDEERAQQPGEQVIGIDIVVPVFNALEDVKVCLASLQSHTDGFRVRVIVVNDGSDEATTQWLREFCEGKQIFSLIEHPTNFGYTRAVNSGLKASTAPYVITQNSDTIVSDGWLTGLIRCMRSAPNIGIVGPLSNAASWQNVPQLRDATGSFAVNDLPAGLDVDAMARTVAQVSVRAYPRLPFVNGFCFMISRAVIEAVGYMDELNFPVGYGEENDYCIRAQDAGFELAIADDVFVFHAKSKSFGHERRKTLSEQGTRSIKNKHTVEKYQARVETVKKTEALDAVRARIQSALEQGRSHDDVDLMSMRILFLLPVKGGGGGAHSVVQEVTEMRRMGIHARVAVGYDQLEGLASSYNDVPNARELFIGFDDASLLDIAIDFDVVVATLFSSMVLAKRVVDRISHILPAYYVQDYEPLFFETGSSRWQQAHDSYTLIPDACLFAKTHWIINEVKRLHGRVVHKVAPSIDHAVYRPKMRPMDGRTHIAAMIRPQTPRRGAFRTMKLLSQLHHLYGERLSIHIFGCETSDPAFAPLIQDFAFCNHGPLARNQVASLLAESDLFLDLSDYQAFGRTALEAMACHCAVVVPAEGGADEYALDGINAIVVDTRDEEACWVAVNKLINRPDLIRDLKDAGLRTASSYSVHMAAVSECLTLCSELNSYRQRNPKLKKPKLVLYPTRDQAKKPQATGQVRLLLPYQSPTVMRAYEVTVSEVLPPSGQAEIALVQRHASGLSLSELRDWIFSWKRLGGKLAFDLDDDMLDHEALRERGFPGDLLEVTAKVELLASSADLVLVSTDGLAKKLRALNTNVHVIPNAIDCDLWKASIQRHHDSGDYAKKDGSIRIGYIGTPTHDADLKLISEAMNVIERKYGSKIEIEVIGGFQKTPPTFGRRVPLPRKHDYPNFVRWLQERVHWDIGVIPLVDDSFNRSKSYLKFLECAALDMAMVVSDVPSYAPVTRHGVNCLLAKPTTEDWVEKLTLLIEDAVVRKKLAQQARLECASHHTLEQVTPRICRALKSLEIEGVVR